MVEVRWVASGFISRTDAPDPHAAQSRAGAQRGNALGREWVICRKARWNTHAAQSRACTQRETYWVASGIIRRTAHWHTRGQSRARTFVEMLLSGFIGRTCTPTRIRHNRLALTAEIHRASVLQQWLSPPDPPCRPATRAPSPLKTTALRVVRDAGYPHACAFRRCDDGCTQSATGRQSLGQGSPADRVLDTHR